MSETLYTGGARVIYAGDGSTAVFPVTFPAENADELQLFLVPADELAEIVTLDNSLWSYDPSSGNVTVVSSSIPAEGEKLVIMRCTPIERRGSYAPGGQLTADSLNADLTRLTKICVDLDERLRLIPGAGVGRVLTGEEVETVIRLYKMIGSGLVMLTSGGWLARGPNNSAAIELGSYGVSISGGIAVSGGAAFSSGDVSIVHGGGSFAVTDTAISGAANSGGAVGAATLRPGSAVLEGTSSGTGGIVGAGGVMSLGSAAARIHYRTAGGVLRGIQADSAGTVVDGDLTASGAVRLASDLTVSGALAISGGVTINGENAATQPWVNSLLGSSGYLKSAGGWTAYRQGGTPRYASSSTGGEIIVTESSFDRSYIRIGDPESSEGGVRIAISGGYFDWERYLMSSAAVHAAGSTVRMEAFSSGYGGYKHSGGMVVHGGYISSFVETDNATHSLIVDSTNAIMSIYNSRGVGVENAYYDIGGDGVLIDVQGATGKQIYLSAYTSHNIIDLRLNGFRVDITSSNGSGGIFLTELGVYSSARVLTDRDAVAQSGAMIEGQPFSTTVGGYTVELTSGGGVSIYGENEHGPGVSALFSNGVISLTALDGYNDTQHELVVHGGAGGIIADGSAITQATSEFEGTSLGIAELAGGVKYICESALTALSIGSAAPGCNATIFFTAANGAIITPPANVRRYGVTTYTPGSSYVMAVNGDIAVVVEEDAGV